DCMHDGLQEWMRADEEFDCANEDRLPDGRCDVSLFDPNRPSAERRHPKFSGYDLIHKIATSPNVRTVLLGHTHNNSMEMFQEGDELVPGKVFLDAEQTDKYEAMEVKNPLRGFSWLWNQVTGAYEEPVYDPAALTSHGIHEDNGRFFILLS